MKSDIVGKIECGQDGAIFNNYLFRLDNAGYCKVYDISETKVEKPGIKEIDSFYVDKKDIVCPHSNSVSFGTEKVKEDDEFPVLYTNVYNNCKKEKDRKLSMILAYRITRLENKFKSELIQIIRLGFTEDYPLWVYDETEISPYGNFAIDKDKNILYAFVMRTKEQISRFFKFNMPGINDGVINSDTGIRTVVLNKEDIKDMFDTKYHNFMQGACMHKGLIYCVEGFSFDKVNVPYIRVIDPYLKKQIFECDLTKDVAECEPEFIEFKGDECYYAGTDEEVYILSFEKGEINEN